MKASRQDSERIRALWWTAEGENRIYTIQVFSKSPQISSVVCKYIVTFELLMRAYVSSFVSNNCWDIKQGLDVSARAKIMLKHLGDTQWSQPPQSSLQGFLAPCQLDLIKWKIHCPPLSFASQLSTIPKLTELEETMVFWNLARSSRRRSTLGSPRSAAKCK